MGKKDQDQGIFEMEDRTTGKTGKYKLSTDEYKRKVQEYPKRLEKIIEFIRDECRKKDINIPEGLDFEWWEPLENKHKLFFHDGDKECYLQLRQGENGVEEIWWGEICERLIIDKLPEF